MTTINRHIHIVLTEEENGFIKWLAKRDKVTAGEELKMLFNLQLREEMELYNEERLQEERESKCTK